MLELKKPCSAPRCKAKLPKSFPGSVCDDCKPKRKRAETQRLRDRPSSSARGYDWKWRKASRKFLEDNPTCRIEDSCHELATLVDHITPVSGASDPLFWDRSNWQPGCAGCHARKTSRETAEGLNRRW